MSFHCNPLTQYGSLPHLGHSGIQFALSLRDTGQYVWLVPYSQWFANACGATCQNPRRYADFVKEPKTTWLSEYPRTTGMFPCNKCQVCLFVHRTSTSTDAQGNGSFEISNVINCSTSRVIYIKTCPCPKIYVGKTKISLKVRIGEYLRDKWQGEDPWKAIGKTLFPVPRPEL